MSVVALVFSMPPQVKSATVLCAYLGYGYGKPKTRWKVAIMAGVFLKSARPSRSFPRGTYPTTGILPA